MKYLNLFWIYLAKVVGRVQYQPPGWVLPLWRRFLATRVGQKGRKGVAAIRANPRKSMRIGGGILAVGLAAWLGVDRYLTYLDSLPKPDYVVVTLDTPQEPDIDDGKPRPLTIRFNKSAAPIEQLDKPVTEGVTLEPAMKGRWHWLSDRELIFEPEQTAAGAAHWEIGAKYKVVLDRKLVPKHVLLKKLDYSFETPQMKGRFTKNEFYQDPRDPNIKRAVFNITYNYPLDTEDFKKRIAMALQTKYDSVLGKQAQKYPFAVTFSAHQNEAYVISDPIPIPKKDSRMRLEVTKGVRSARGGTTIDNLSRDVDVPGMFDLFRFEESQVSFARNAKFEPEQILIVKTGAELPTETLAKSMKLYLLPKKKADDKSKRRYSHWHSASEIVADVRGQMETVAFTVVPSEQENSKIHTFKINVPVGRFVYIEVPKGLKSYGGYELQENYAEIVSFPEYPKELMIMSQGSILSMGGDRKVPLLARNVHRADFHLYRILPSQLNQFVFHSFRYGGDFGRPQFQEVPRETLSEVFKKTVAVPFKGPAATQYFSIDLDPYLGKDATSGKGIFFVDVSSDAGPTDRRLILVTDLGVVVKEANDKSHQVFVENLRGGGPVADAEVEVIGTNGLTVISQRTGPTGLASFPNLSEFKNEKRPLAFVVKKGADMAYLPFRMENRQLSFSRFDVGGLLENPESDQLTSYLFSDRGIYRPGDTVNLGMMVRARNWKKYFKSVPLSWSVTDPRGVEVKREKMSVSSDDLTSLSFATQDAGATGVYEIHVYITKKNETDEQIGALTVRIEEFIPDRMKISAKIEGGKVQGWVAPKDLKGRVTLSNLFGTPAENRRVTAEIALNPAHPQFRTYKDFQFSFLKSDEKPYSESLSPGETDAKGEATFDFDLARFTGGMYSLRFEAEGFEAAGGRGVGASSATLVSALPYLIGVKPDNPLNYVNKGSKQEISVIAINPDLAKIAVSDAQVVIVERRYVSALMQQTDGTYKYHSVLKEIPGDPKPFAVSAAGSKFKLPTETPGEFLAVFKNKAGAELNRVAFSVIGEANVSRSLERNAELQVVLNKKDYNPGEEIELNIKAPYVGAGLITIERDRVLTHKWFKTSTTSAVEKIAIPAGVEGGAYVNVTFLRAIDSPEIYMSPLSYAVVPFSISLDEHKIDLKIEAPEKVKPGEKLVVKYHASKNTKLILYGVDEGILQVAKYSLPNPLEYFFQRQALQVLTYQLLDLLLPEYSVIQKMAAPGGDADAAARLNRNLNPFKRKADKPVAFWSGVLDGGPQTKTFSYDVPDYFNGNLKLMALASNGAAFGSAEQGVLSRGDFIITSNIPTFVVPGDEFVVGVGLSNQAEGTGEKASVKLEVQSPAFEVLGPAEQSITVAEGHEGSAEFKLKAKAMLGSRPIKFRASSGAKSAKASVETSIRPAVPYTTTLSAGRASKASFDLDVARDLLPEFRTQTASLSPVPGVFAHGLKDFLDGYPYGCSEQVTSKIFPYILLKDHPEFAIDSKKAVAMFSLALETLRTRQTTDGGFAMYGVGGGAHRQVTLYVTHMLLEAKERGFSVPEDVLNKVLVYLESEPMRDTSSLAGARAFAYSLYLRARAGRVPGDDLKFLHQALMTRYKEVWAQDLAAAWLAAAFKLVKQEDLAQGIFRKLQIGTVTPPNYEYFYDQLVRDTAIVYLNARHFPELLKEISDEAAMAKAFAPLGNGHYSTQSSAFALLALDAIFKYASGGTLLSQMKMEEIHADGQAVTLPIPPNSLMPKVPFSDKAKKIRYGSPAEYLFYYMQAQSGFDRELPKKEIKSKLELTREYLNPAGSPVTSAKMGDEVKVRLRLRSLDQTSVNYVAIVDMLPSGLEPILEPIEVASESGETFDGNAPGKRKRHHHRADEEVMDGESDEATPPPEGQGQDESESPDQGALYRFFRVFLPEALAENAAKATTTAIDQLLPQYVDRREDRLVIYAGARPDIQEYIYRAKAVAKGKFVVPPAFAESMYDRDAQYRGLANAFTVEAP